MFFETTVAHFLNTVAHFVFDRGANRGAFSKNSILTVAHFLNTVAHLPILNLKPQTVYRGVRASPAL